MPAQKKRLLIVAHCPSPNTEKMVHAMLRGIKEQELDNVDVQHIPPLKAGPDDILACDAIILGTTENLGYMSGALKDFFDRSYYPVLEEKQGLPVAAIIRAGHDGTGTKRALETILTGLKWRWVQEPIICRGEWQEEFLQQSEELAAAMAVALDTGII